MDSPQGETPRGCGGRQEGGRPPGPAAMSDRGEGKSWHRAENSEGAEVWPCVSSRVFKRRGSSPRAGAGGDGGGGERGSEKGAPVLEGEGLRRQAQS